MKTWKRAVTLVLSLCTFLLLTDRFFPQFSPFDDGHNIVGVKSDGAADAYVREAFKVSLGLGDFLVIDEARPAHQVVLTDGNTVVNWVSQMPGWERFSASAVTRVTKHPKQDAEAFVKVLKSKYGDTESKEVYLEGRSDPIVLVRSEALDGIVVGFRRHKFLLGTPPPIYKLFYAIASVLPG